MDRFDLGISEQLNVVVMSNLDGAGGKNTLSAVERGKGLRELRHTPTDGGQAID
jgi:hypothetical protein